MRYKYKIKVRKKPVSKGLAWWLSGNESTYNAGDPSTYNAGDSGSIPGLGRSPGEGNGQPTPVFWPGESHGQRSLTDYSPWAHKELDTT